MKRCKESFTIWRDNAPVAYTAGQLVEDDAEILRSHGHLFAELEPTVRAPSVVEAATAEPGERRSVTPPAKTSARKPSTKKE
ncbi:hypothetical protein [Streptomyces sp. NPDC052225]|uniref:hypothetical protein n=1 Tax=Streptomyces sp. NPDC052225 TaxID=3154949 RepID=UPI003439B40A